MPTQADQELEAELVSLHAMKIVELCQKSPLGEAGDLCAVAMALAVMAVDQDWTEEETVEAFRATFRDIAPKYKAMREREKAGG